MNAILSLPNPDLATRILETSHRWNRCHVAMDISDDSELEVLQVSQPRRARPRRRRAAVVPTVDLVRPAKRLRKTAVAPRQAKQPKQARPKPKPVIELDDEDRVIETCSSYEEAFFGKPQTSKFPSTKDDVISVVSQSPAPAPEPPAPPVTTRRVPPAPSLSLLALSLKAWRQSQLEAPKPLQPLSCVTLPKELSLPAAPIAPVAVADHVQPQEKAEVVRFDEDPEELLPQVPYSQAYVERLRNSSAAHGVCCVCKAPFVPGELRFGYVAEMSDSQREQAKWLHSRCLGDEELQMAPGEWVAVSPLVTNDELQRLMAILSIRRSSPIRRPKLWCYPPAICQGWQRWAVPRNGAARPVPGPRYTAPLLSLVSQQARAVLLRARQRRSQSGTTSATAQRRPATGTTGPSLVARRAQVTATSRRPATSAPEPERRRQWRRQNALGDRAKEFFAAAPVMILTKDWSSEEPCIICHENLLKGDEVRRLPCCHTFHRSCIDRWLRLKAVCPLDKLSVQQLLSQPKDVGVTESTTS